MFTEWVKHRSDKAYLIGDYSSLNQVEETLTHLCVQDKKSVWLRLDKTTHVLLLQMMLQLLLSFSPWQHSRQHRVSKSFYITVEIVPSCSSVIIKIWFSCDLVRIITWQDYQIRGSIYKWRPLTKQEQSVSMWKLFSHLGNVYHKALKERLDSSSANSTFVVSWWGRTLVAACLMSRVVMESTAR